jgi:predicted 2-oxoglutarate/Fe(II)-dependent dioxygenase YbiX
LDLDIAWIRKPGEKKWLQRRAWVGFLTCCPLIDEQTSVGNLLKHLGSDIFLVEHLLDPSLCAHVIQVAECCEFRVPPAGASLTGELRSNEVLPLDTRSSLLESTTELLVGAVNQLRQLMSRQYEVPFSHLEMYAIERSRPGQTHKRHMDGLVLGDRYTELAQGIPARDVSVIGYLNEDFEGGELLFDRQALKVKPATGGVVLFPAHYTHPYQALPVLRGCKYTFTAWLFH